MSTSSGCPATWPSTSVPEKVVLKALTTLAAAGALFATSSAADVPGAVASPSKVWFRGLDISTTTLPASLSPSSLATSRSEEHTSELQSRQYLVCRLLL